MSTISGKQIQKRHTRDDEIHNLFNTFNFKKMTQNNLLKFVYIEL